MTTNLPDNAPQPRECHVTKWEHFTGYGFNLHAEKSKPGQYIGKIDEGSPAEKAGLREGDRIIEVNGVNISNENHKQVVQRIKAVANETRLLVVDQDTESYFKKNDIIITGSLPNVLYLSSELKNDNENNKFNEEEEEEDEIVEKMEEVRMSPPVEQQVHVIGEDDSNSVRSVSSAASSTDKKPFGGSTSGSSPRSTPSPEPNSRPTRDYPGLNLNMSAREMRERIGSKKKKDPRKDDRMDFKKKYDIIQKL